MSTTDRLATVRRYLLIAAAAVGVFLILGFLGVKYYLSSGAVATKVSTRLETLLGMPVSVGQADIGLGSDSAIHDVKGFEPDNIQPDRPWITVQKIHADVGALDLLGDAAPKDITLSGVSLYLRFDKDGNLLTQLPHPPASQGGALPKIHIEKGQVTLDQAGRKPMVVNGITGDITAADKLFTLIGTVDDPYWEKWDAHATAATDTGDVVLDLKTPRAQVTQEKLDRLPFVSASVWANVQAEGVTPVDFKLRFNTNGRGVKYRVALTPVETHVKVTSIKLDADHASGKVVVEDALVTLREVKGQFVDGDILLPSADLDFRKQPEQMKFDLAVKDLQLQKLRKVWPIPGPASLEGKLTGKAKLEVVLREGMPHTSGSGTGAIATVLFNQAAQIQLTLHADEEGFHFNTPTLLHDAGLPALLLPKAPASGGASFLPPGIHGDGVGLVAVSAEGQPIATPILDVANWIVEGVVQTGAVAGRRLERFFGKLAPEQKATYLDVKVALDDVDLATMVKQLGLKLNFPVSGRVSFAVVASLPVDAPSDLHNYRARGTVTLSRVEIAGVSATNLAAKLNYREGVLTLDDVSGNVPTKTGEPGRFTGDVRVAVSPAGDLTTRLKLTDVPTDNLLSTLPVGADAGRRVSGDAEARAPYDRLNDPAAWTGTADLRSEESRAYGLTLTKASAHVALAKGVATVERLSGLLENAHLSGSGRVTLQGAFPFDVALKLANADLRSLEKLKAGLRPPLQLSGAMDLETNLQGTLAPLVWKDAGTAKGRNVVVEGVAVQALSFRWNTAADRINLHDIDGRLNDGGVTGSAVLPLKPTAPLTLDLDLDKAEIGPAARRLLGSSVPLQGRASGGYHAKWDAVGPDGVRANTTRLDLTSPLLNVMGFGVKQVIAHIDVAKGATRYNLTGSALDGKLELTGTLPPAGQPVPPDAPAGRLSLQNGRLSKLGEALHLGSALDELRGTVTLDIDYRHGPDGFPVGRGHIAVGKVRWGMTDVTDGVRADLTLNGQEVRVSGLTGGLGTGDLGGRIVFNLKDPERSHFNLTLDRAEATQVVTPLQALLTTPANAAGPTLPPVQGALQVHLRGNLGREWRGTGTVVLTRGKVYGVDVTEWRLPVDFTYHPRHGRAQIDIRDSTAQFAQGRGTGEASFVFGAASRLEGTFRFADVDLRGLVRSAGDVGSLAAGRVTGKLKFSGNEVRSLDDVTATLDAALSQTQALELPVLRLIVPYVMPGAGAATFQKGDLQARLAQGVIRVQHLSLVSDLVKVVIEGTVTPRQGRLNLEATATTGSLGGLNNGTLLLLARQVPAVGPVPVGLIAEVSTFVANRAVHLRIGGTLRTPSVQVEPVALLTEEAIRLLLGRVNVFVP